MVPIPVGDTAVEIIVDRVGGQVISRVRALADAVRADPPSGTLDVVPALDRVMIVYDIGRIGTLQDFVGHLAATAESSAARRPAAGRVHEIPVCYGGEHGPDLAEVCATHGLDRDDLVRLHTSPLYAVEACGFVPGFAYLAGLPAELATPRRATPRAAVPAGSVGIGGDRTGVYPLQVPGGWNIIGRSPLRLFDPERQPPALLCAGDQVRFVEIAPTAFPGPPARSGRSHNAAGAVTVIAAGLWTTIQDLGRPGHRAEGVPVSGAVDQAALRLANLLVGNPEGAAALECTLIGPELRFDRDAVVAVAGAEFPGLPSRRAMRVTAGSRLVLGHARTGCRGYLAVAGGIDVPPDLGSRSTYVPGLLGGLSGGPLAAGDHLPVGLRDLPPETTGAIGPGADRAEPARPCTLRIIPAADAGKFGHVAWERGYRVSARSDRMGVRLEGSPIGSPGGGTVSVPVLPGTVQVPPSGSPIVLLADAQTIGGYPVLGQVIAADLPLAGQLRPGASVCWQPVTLDEAHDAFRSGEAAFDRLRGTISGRSAC